jgi:hypothetical protein
METVLRVMLRTRHVTGNTGKVFDGLAALSTSNNLLTLRRLMLEPKPKRTLEIGLSFGVPRLCSVQHIATSAAHPLDSTLLWIRFKRLSGIEPVSWRWSVPGYLDIWISGPHFLPSNFQKCLNATSSLKWSTWMARTLLRMCSSTLILSCVSCDEGGVVAFDDSSNRHVAKVLRFLRPSLHGRLEELDLSGYRTYGADGLMYRMARRLGKV